MANGTAERLLAYEEASKEFSAAEAAHQLTYVRLKEAKTSLTACRLALGNLLETKRCRTFAFGPSKVVMVRRNSSSMEDITVEIFDVE